MIRLTSKPRRLLWRALVIMTVGVALSLPAAMAGPAQLLQDIEYVKIKNQQAVKVVFSTPIRYVSHFPKHRSKEVTVLVDTLPNDDATETQQLVQTLPIPAANGIPLLGVVLVIEDSTKKLIIRFTEAVDFSVSQISGSSSITIIVGGSEIKQAAEEPLKGAEVIPKVSTSNVADNVIAKYMNAGRKALTKGKTKDAIQIFTKVLSMPDNQYKQDALEYLGVARERNNQAAHAKLIYQQYLKLYPEGEGAERVKQRFADLVAGQLLPRQKLKTTTSLQREKGFEHQFTGTLAQYYYYGKNNIDEATSTADQKLLVSQLSFNHRMRSANTDIRNFIFVDHERDFIEKESEDPEINSLYSKIKNSKYGLYVTAGRQSASTAGVLGKFDGFQLGYDIKDSMRANLVAGYPVDISDKTRIQTNKFFYGVNMEFINYWKNWNVSPYLVQQKVDGLTDREVIGTEIRYFSEKGNLFSIVDYDTLFSDLNIFMLRGQYGITEKSVFLLTLDYRKNPLLEASNALIGDATNSSISDLQASLTEEEIIARAKDRTGDSSTISLGINNTLTSDIQLNADVTYAQQSFALVDTSGNTSRQDEDQTYFSTQLVINRILNHHDTTIFDLRQSQTSVYDETQFSISHRIPLESKLRIQTRLFLSKRNNESGETLDRIRPSINLSYRSRRSVNIFSELNYEWWKYGGDTVNNDYQRLFINLGYQWLF